MCVGAGNRRVIMDISVLGWGGNVHYDEVNGQNEHGIKGKCPL